MRDTPCDVWGVFLGYDGIIKQFNIFTILLSISLSPVIGMTGLPVICLHGISMDCLGILMYVKIFFVLYSGGISVLGRRRKKS
jgi:uncharacterized protein with PQ loop repeat